jgi:hypothetical protein
MVCGPTRYRMKYNLHYGIPIGIILFIWLAWLGSVILDGLQYSWLPLSKLNFDRAAKFGDSFGGLNALMASTAAAGAWIAVYLQSKQLQNQKEQSVKEAFEARFFALLELHTKIVAALDIRKKERTSDLVAVGKDVFKHFSDELNEFFSHAKNGLIATPNFTAEQVYQAFLSPGNRPTQEMAQELYQHFYLHHQDDLGHFFQNLFLLIQFVDHADGSINIKEKYFAVRIVRAQLSQSELYFIFLNCAFGEGREKFKPLAEKYALFNNLDLKKQSLTDQFRNIFSNDAYRSLSDEVSTLGEMRPAHLLR